MKNIVKLSLLLALGSITHYTRSAQPKLSIQENPSVMQLAPGQTYKLGTLAPNFSINNPEQIISYSITHQNGDAVSPSQAVLKMIKQPTPEYAAAIKAGTADQICGMTEYTYTYTLHINPKAQPGTFVIMQKNAMGQISQSKIVYVTKQEVKPTPAALQPIKIITLSPSQVYNIGTIVSQATTPYPGKVFSYSIAYANGKSVPTSQAVLKVTNQQTNGGAPGSASFITYTLIIPATAHEDQFQIMKQAFTEGNVPFATVTITAAQN